MLVGADAGIMIPSCPMAGYTIYTMVMPASATKSHQGAPVWDIPLRLFHWLFAIAVVGAYITGDNEQWFFHEKFGLAVLGLLGFRLIWGFIGGHHARFRQLRLAPAALVAYSRARSQSIFAYLSGKPSPHQYGHSPVGSWATLVILAVMLGMAMSGIFADHHGIFYGPMVRLFGLYDISGFASEIHEAVHTLVIPIVVLHVLAVIGYRYVWGIRLLPPMLQGRHDPALPAMSARHQVLGVVLLVMCVASAQALGLIADEG